MTESPELERRIDPTQSDPFAADESDGRTTALCSAAAASAATGAAAAATTKRSHNKRWDEQFQRLLEFKRVHGHCNVPFRYPQDPTLGRWASQQRAIYKSEMRVGSSGPSVARQAAPDYQLLQERLQRLMAVDFDWNPVDSKQRPWEWRFSELVKFVESHGHSKVPFRWERKEYRRFQSGRPSRITQDQIDQLNSVRFCWNALKRPAPVRQGGLATEEEVRTLRPRPQPPPAPFVPTLPTHPVFGAHSPPFATGIVEPRTSLPLFAEPTLRDGRQRLPHSTTLGMERLLADFFHSASAAPQQLSQPLPPPLPLHLLPSNPPDSHSDATDLVALRSPPPVDWNVPHLFPTLNAEFTVTVPSIVGSSGVPSATQPAPPTAQPLGHSAVLSWPLGGSTDPWHGRPFQPNLTPCVASAEGNHPSEPLFVAVSEPRTTTAGTFVPTTPLEGPMALSSLSSSSWPPFWWQQQSPVETGATSLLQSMEHLPPPPLHNTHARPPDQASTALENDAGARSGAEAFSDWRRTTSPPTVAYFAALPQPQPPAQPPPVGSERGAGVVVEGGELFQHHRHRTAPGE